MSRAFVRESEPAEPRCPECGGLGDQVGPTTLNAHVPEVDRSSLGVKAYYCANPACRTAYFNSWGASVPLDRITGGTYPKHPDGPLCPCFGVTAAEVIADAREGRKDRVRDLIDRSRGPGARCAERCPDGLPCIPRVLRLFRERYEARQGG